MDAPTQPRDLPDRNRAIVAPSGEPTLGADELRRTNAYWRAANYLSVGQIYLYDNPLLREPLTMAHIKPLVVGHWGTTPGQNFIYAHLNRVIKKHDLDMIHIAGPGHGGPALVGNVYLEGTWTEVYPNVTQDEAGLKKLFKQFSFPGGISSHVAPTTPGSIHEGGELGYSLSHAFGAAFDNPELIVACIVGDGEAETGPLATAWQSNKFLDPITDGAVLPILHLNGYKISNPTVLARIEHDELEQFFRGCGWTPYFVEGDAPATMHELMATVLERAIEDIRQLQATARATKDAARPRWPMIVLRSPKGWTGPKIVDGLQVEGTFRAHQVPLLVDHEHPQHVAQLESWMKSYKPEELFDKTGRLIDELAELAPKGDRRMGANPNANGGILLHDLHMPDFREHAVRVPSPGAVDGQDTMVLGKFLKDIVKLNQRNFRIFGPDETVSNLLGAVFEVTNRQWDARRIENDEFLAPAGRVLDSMLSEHQCEGWLEGYLLTGRHGLFNSYEAFTVRKTNAHALARYAALCQEAGMVPIVEPEVLMDGEHTLERCREVTEATLRCVFSALSAQRVMLEGMILKPNMVLPGLNCAKQEGVDEVAAATVDCLLRVVPAAVPGIAFLSGGQSAELASARLNAMNIIAKSSASRLPWMLAFSFARAIQQPALEIWRGQEDHVATAQAALVHRARCNRAALRGEYTAAMERT